MVTTSLKMFKLQLNSNTVLYEIVLASYMSLSVTHVKGNILERQAKKKTKTKTQSLDVSPTHFESKEI